MSINEMNRKRKLPNFFIVGAPKSGTTALNQYLNSHPNIFMAPKERHFFVDSFNGRESIDSYLRLFKRSSDQHYALGEASVWYLHTPEPLQNIYRFNNKLRNKLYAPYKLVVFINEFPYEMVFTKNPIKPSFVHAEKRADLQYLT